jgi:hypothetical protein
MKKIVLTMFLSTLLVLGANAQYVGQWYVGTGNIANIAWTDWSVSPTVGYGVTDKIMVGANVSQVDSTADMEIDLHARYYVNGYFAYVATNGLSTDGVKLGLGKMFSLTSNVYLDPKVVYNTTEKTTNLQLGFGFKF